MIKKTKFLFENKFEPFEKQFNRLRSFCKSNRTLFFMVFEGKFSEGVDFKDELARMIIIIGIPFSNFGAIEVKAKKEYL